MHAGDIRAEVDRVMAQWHAAPPVTVVDDVSALPAPAFDDAAGMYHRGEAWLVTKNVPRKQAGRILAHEVLGHHGVKQLLGSRHRSFLLAISQAAREGDSRLLTLRQHVEAAYRDEDGQAYLPPAALADEIGAHAAEWTFDAVTGQLNIPNPRRRAFRALRGHVAREVLLLDHPACADQVLGMLLEAEAGMRGNGFLLPVSRLWYFSPMNKPMGPRVPARDLAESESMLAAEKYRMDAPGEWKMIGQFGLVIVACIAALAGVGYWVLLLLGIIRI